MKLDAVFAVAATHMNDAAAIARTVEAIGFAGLWSGETRHNAYLPLVIAAQQSERIELGTAVALAFPRSPMVTAQIAWDLQAFSRGRFILGLGTQVRAHIEQRFGMPWGPPLDKIRDYIQALRAIWNTFQTGAPLEYRGRFYKHTLMLPFFNPGRIEHPHIPIYVAGVNKGLMRLAGELCEGFHVHPLHSVKYLKEIVRPQVAAGAARAQRSASDVVLAAGVFTITGPDEATMEQVRGMVRQQIAFYASTPTYRVVLAVHGWEDVGEQLRRLAALRRWGEMSTLITDEMLDAFAIQAPFGRVGQVLCERYEGVLDRVACYIPFVPGGWDDMWRDTVATVHRS
jgi:probable F420-dependent oxidoreductase